MRVACFTPLRPSRTGVGDYAAVLLPRLMERLDLEIFVEDTRSFLAYPGWPIFSCRDFGARNRKKPFDLCLYQLGNNGLHRFAYRAALERPGVVVLHDALLQHLLLGISRQAWEEEFAFTYGERGREIAANLRDGNPALHEGFFRYPLVKRVAERSQRVIVHNQAAVGRVRGEAPQADVGVLPLPFAPRGGEMDRAQARHELGLPARAFLVGCFGYMREARRLTVALRAFEALRRDHIPSAEFLLVGEFESPELERLLEPLLAKRWIHRAGYVPDEEFDQYAAASNVVVNLRYPSAGETSGVAVRLMGLGVPVVLSDIPENAAFPADACLRVPPGEIEEPLLLEYLKELARNPAFGRAIGETARSYIRREHNADRCAEMYVEALTP